MLLRKILLLLAFFTIQTHSQVSDDCMYYYLEQPLQEPNCNPYGGDLLLRCVVLGPLESAFSIEWYRRDLTSVEVMLSGAQELGPDFGHTPQPRRMRSDLRIAPEDVIPAQYWCQIRVSGDLLERSREINIAAVYSGISACSRENDQSMPENPPICADLNQATSEPPPSQPTSSTDSTPPSSPDPDSSSPPSSPDPDSSPNSVPPATPTPTVLPTDDEDQSSGGGDSSLETVLYVVIAIIVIFCVIIVTLSVAIVILYRKKVGHVVFKRRGQNTYAGFIQERTQSPSTTESKPPSRPPSSRSHHSHLPPPPTHTPAPPSTEDDDHAYSHLREHNIVPPPNYPQHEYSKLGAPGDTPPPPPREYSKLEAPGDTPPPRPPKPPLLQTHSNPPPTADSAESPLQRSGIYDDFEEGPAVNAVVPRTSIYDTLPEVVDEGEPLSGHYYHILENPAGEDATASNKWPVRSKVNVPLPQGSSGDVSTQKSLFDDPEYSSLKPGNPRSIEVVDHRYIGDYERAPNYVKPTMKLPAENVDPKYLGDYEWDPNYIPKPPSRQPSCEEKPPKPPQRRESLGAADKVARGADRVARDDKPARGDKLANYAGDYERDPSYIPPPLRNGNVTTQTVELGKYRGNYERDPQYMAALASRASRQGKGVSVEYAYPYPPVEDLVPPHIPHEYTALEEALRDPPQEYAKLTPDQPPLTPSSINTTV